MCSVVLTAGFLELLFAAGWITQGAIIAILGMIAVTLLFYDIFKPVNRRLSLLRGVLQPRGTHI